MFALFSISKFNLFVDLSDVDDDSLDGNHNDNNNRKEDNDGKTNREKNRNEDVKQSALSGKSSSDLSENDIIASANAVRRSYSPNDLQKKDTPHRRRKAPIDSEEFFELEKQQHRRESLHQQQHQHNELNQHCNEKNEFDADDNTTVSVDVQRVHVLLRRELAQYRKLLQMKNFFVGAKAATPSVDIDDDRGSLDIEIK